MQRKKERRRNVEGSKERRPKKKWKKRHKLVEIKTNTKGWHEVELISVNKGGTITVKLPNGQIFTKKMTHVRWGRTKRIPNLVKKVGNKRILKYLKTKKKRRRGKKPKRRRFSAKKVTNSDKEMNSKEIRNRFIVRRK